MKKLLVLMLLVSIVLLSGCVGQIKEVTNTTVQIPTTTEATTAISTTTTTIKSYSGLYKKPNDFEFLGYEYCIFVFDSGQEEYVNKTEYVYKKFCNITEGYPYIHEFLYNKYKVDIEKKDWQTEALYKGNGIIVINAQYKEAKNLDSAIAHEIAHSSTESLYLPNWLSEGIAKYSSFKFFGTEGKLTSYWFEDFYRWDPNNSTYGESIKGYQHAGFVVKNFIEKYGGETFKNFLKEIYGKINYRDDINTKNEKVLDAIRKVTNNSSLTLKDVINP